MSTARVLVVDDYEPWRRFVCSMFERRSELEIVGEAADGLEAVQRARELRPDVVLLDLGMPNLNGMEAATQIRRCSPDSCIVFITSNNDTDIKDAALASGAEYVLKAKASCELLPAIDTVLQNRDRGNWVRPIGHGNHPH